MLGYGGWSTDSSLKEDKAWGPGYDSQHGLLVRWPAGNSENWRD